MEKSYRGKLLVAVAIHLASPVLRTLPLTKASWTFCIDTDIVPRQPRQYHRLCTTQRNIGRSENRRPPQDRMV